MIDKNIKDYIKVYENIIEKDLCDAAVNSLSKEEIWEDHYYHNNTTDERVTFEND